MTVEEVIKKLKRFPPHAEVCLLDHRCLEAFPVETNTIRRATKKEASDSYFDEPLIIE